MSLLLEFLRREPSESTTLKGLMGDPYVFLKERQQVYRERKKAA